VKALCAVQVSIFQYGHLMLGAVPLPDQDGPAVYANLLGSVGNLAACGGIVGDSLEQPQSRRFEAAKGFLLKPIGNPLNQQRGAKFRRWVGAEEDLPPVAEFRGVQLAESIQL
jgi:hypothetical protein